MVDDPALPRRTRDLALLVPLVGVLLLVPPMVGLFARPDIAVFGIPLIIIYLFGLWLTLIVVALWLARRLKQTTKASG